MTNQIFPFYFKNNMVILGEGGRTKYHINHAGDPGVGQNITFVHTGDPKGKSKYHI